MEKSPRASIIVAPVRVWRFPVRRAFVSHVEGVRVAYAPTEAMARAMGDWWATGDESQIVTPEKKATIRNMLAVIAISQEHARDELRQWEQHPTLEALQDGEEARRRIVDLLGDT